MAAHNRGDYATALRLWRPLADQGRADAQFNLGRMYDRAQGVPQDFIAAVGWYRKAADQGHEASQFNLGATYYMGEGVPQDYVAAVGWFRRAADQGDADAQFFLGRMYADGQGVPCNVAARLCAEAKDGQVLISQRVNVALKGSLTTEQVGALALKGLTQPVVAYNVPIWAT